MYYLYKKIYTYYKKKKYLKKKKKILMDSNIITQTQTITNLINNTPSDRHLPLMRFPTPLPSKV